MGFNWVFKGLRAPLIIIRHVITVTKHVYTTISHNYTFRMSFLKFKQSYCNMVQIIRNYCGRCLSRTYRNFLAYVNSTLRKFLAVSTNLKKIAENYFSARSPAKQINYHITLNYITLYYLFYRHLCLSFYRTSRGAFF
jgi:hypothetical protein